jgi:hypothetical protein
MRFPVRVTGQTIFQTFTRTTVIERETTLTRVVLDPPDFEERKGAAFASDEVMVRDTEAGIRYLEKTKDGGRVPAAGIKNEQLFGLAGIYYDKAYDTPLPLLGAYYVNFDTRRSGQQTQIFFGGVVLAGSWSKPGLLGTKLNVGADVFGIAIRGTDTIWADGVELDSEDVETRRFGFNLNVSYPVLPRVSLGVTAGVDHQDFAPADTTAPEFAIPSNFWLARLEARLTWDLSGYAFKGTYGWYHRSDWEPWGFPGNPDYAPGKDGYEIWTLGLAKNFDLPSFRQIKLSALGAGTRNADRFSKITFGRFSDTPLLGFASGSLRAETAALFSASYAFVVGSFFRLAAEYDHALIWDAAAGYSGTSFGGAGVNGQLPGPWATLLQLSAGAPVVGRDKGQTGFVLSFSVLKIF